MPAKDYHLDKFHIISSTEQNVEEIVRLCKMMKSEHFFHADGKWSVAENLVHLQLSLSKSWQALFVPKFIAKWMFGKPQHTSLPYEQLMEVYDAKLQAGAVATKAYIPLLVNNKKSKEELIEQFEHVVNRYLNEIRYYWEETNMDKSQYPHPLLGKITARELMYFNVFHCAHHFRTMRQLIDKGFEL